MLTLMRRHAQSWFIKVALGIIAIVFIFWGVGSYSAKDANRAALVNGQVISLAEYSEAYQDRIKEERLKYGDALNDSLIKKLNLKKVALEELVSRTLVLQEAERLGVVISDEVLQASIISDPSFQENGAFSPRRYELLLNANKLDKVGYEESIRTRMITSTMMGRLGMLTQVSEDEIIRFFHLRNDRIKISHVDFDPLSYREGIALTEAEISEFFQKNKEAYQEPERVSVDYLAFNADDYLAKAEVSPEQVKEIYDLTMDSFKEPAKAKIRDVLFKFPDEAKEEEVAEIKAKAEAFLAKAKEEGADFIALAKVQEPEADWTKEPEWTPRNMMEQNVADAVFSVEPGKLTEVVENKNGFHVIRVEDRKEARQKEFDEVKDQIEKDLKREKAKELALEAAESAYGLSLDVKSMTDLGAKVGLKSGSTGLFSKNAPPAGPFSNSNFIEAAFSLEEGEVGPAVELDNAYYLIMTTKKVPSHVPDLEKVKTAVETDLTQQKAKDKALAAAKELLEKAKGGNWLTLIREGGYELKEAPAFTRWAPVEGLGRDLAMNAAAFKLSFRNPLPDQVFEVNNKFSVIHFEDREKADPAGLEKEKENLRRAIASQRQRELASAWIEELRQRADVEIYEKAL